MLAALRFDTMTHDPIVGCILGTAVGDALGLPYEGVSRRWAAQMLGPPDRYRFVFGRGMVSDDTEHTCMVAQSLIDAAGSLEKFQRSLAWRFRWWLLSLPAGIGLATLRAILRLWFGFGPTRSGVFSAGNGPAMRSAILGAAIDDLPTLRQWVRAATRITHTDPKAEFGAFAVALAARLSRGTDAVTGEGFYLQLESALDGNGAELLELTIRAVVSVQRGESTEAFADSIGQTTGVSGYVYHSVPVALHAWLSHPRDFSAAVQSVIRCGGDTDTTAAIVGGIVGSAVGVEGIPSAWLSTLLEWPRSVGWMKALSHQLASSPPAMASQRAIRLPICGVVPRNAFFLVVVLFHGVRRFLLMSRSGKGAMLR